jgi:hypothetical protein
MAESLTKIMVNQAEVKMGGVPSFFKFPIKNLTSEKLDQIIAKNRKWYVGTLKSCIKAHKAGQVTKENLSTHPCGFTSID